MELTGLIKKLIFRSEDGTFFIFLLEDSSDHRNKKVKGTFVVDTPAPGQVVTLEGAWEDTKWGPTFAAASLSVSLPTTDRGLMEYLQSHVQFIGPVLSKRLVETFGGETLRVLDEEPERLVEVARLSQRAREELVENWQEQRYYRRVAVELLQKDIPKKVIKGAYDLWGAKTLDRLKANPYVIMEVPYAGFQLADRLALQMGVDPCASIRLAGLFEYVLERVAQTEGHLYLTLNELIKTQLGKAMHADKLVGFGRPITKTELAMGIKELQGRGRVELDGSRLYLSHLYRVETQAADRMVQMLKANSPLASVDTVSFLDDYERIQGINLSEQQREAVTRIAEHPVVLVTGLPGTGKTTVSRAIVKLFRDADLRVELLSPTGIAAKKLSTVVGFSASTIHRALGYRGDSWTHGPNNPLSVDAVLVDEFSMVDQELLYRLLGALKPGTVLVCVGDHAQLPSVGAGNVLHELIRSGVVPQVNLTRIFRQGETSGIILGAHRINKGEPPARSHKDFEFREVSSDARIKVQIKKLVEELQRTTERGETFQVLSPRWAGELGVTRLNEAIREVLNPDTGQKTASVGKGVTWRVGDRVIVTNNDYDLGVYNGEQGTITDIDGKNKEVMIRIRDGYTKVVPVKFGETHKMLKLAFCITIHKSQGQEFDYVILPFVDSYSVQLQRNLLYTAITRAKTKVVMLGDWSSVVKAVSNNEVTRRNTQFAKRLRDLVG